jgi:hypothetical protein
MFFSKSTALKAILPVAGAALAAGVIGAAAPAQAMPITIDNFNTPRNLTTAGTASTGPFSQVLSTGSPLGTVTRATSLSSTRVSGIENLANSFDIGSGEAFLNLAANHRGTATVNYTFTNAYNFSATPLIKFDYTYDVASVSRPITLSFSLGAAQRSVMFNSGADVAGTQVFDFTGEVLSNITTASLMISGGTARDITLTSPIVAAPPSSPPPSGVPVPPAVLATGVGAVIGGLKASRKRKQEAAMA